MNLLQIQKEGYHRVCSVRYRYARYRYGCRTELTEVSGTGIDVVPNLPKCPVPVYGCCTEFTEVSGTGIDVVPNLPKCPVPVWKYVPVTVTGNGSDFHTGTGGIRTEHTRHFAAVPACISTHF